MNFGMNHGMETAKAVLALGLLGFFTLLAVVGAVRWVLS